MTMMAPLFAPLRADDPNRVAYLAIEERLRPFFDAKIFSSTDVHVAARLCRRADVLDPDIALALALAVRAPSKAHICVNLETLVLGDLLETDHQERANSEASVHMLSLPDDVHRWCRQVEGARQLVRRPCENRLTPFVLDGPWLYINRFWRYQDLIVDRVKCWTQEELFWSDTNGLVALALDQLFRPPGDQVEDPTQLNRQRLAAAQSLSSPFTVITGGPGMGKTWTVRNLIALLCLECMSRNGGQSLPRIALAAPTGKAAVRIRESILNGLESDFRQALEGCVPVDTCNTIIGFIRELTPKTLHRLLGYQNRTPSRFRHNRTHPLPYDIVIVDEVSMVDFANMAKLVDAMGDSPDGRPFRLILLGDRDQLASVEAGTVLADICGPTSAARITISEGWAKRMQEVHGLQFDSVALSDDALALVEGGRSMSDAIIQFDRTYRFAQDSAIGRFTSACLADPFDADAAIQPFVSSDSVDAQLIEYPQSKSESVWGSVDAIIRNAFRPFCERLSTGWMSDSERYPTKEVYWRRCLESFEQFRILCAHRIGRSGVSGLNERCLRILRRSPTYPVGLNITDSHWSGRPILITRNDYSVKRFNGDIGLIFPEDDGPTQRWTAVFPGRDALPSEAQMEARGWSWVEGEDFGGDKSIVETLSVERLPPHELVFAMTIHKSQGSEFDHVMMVLPDLERPTRLLTRELVYTGITRAKRNITIVSRKALLRDAVKASITRASCLRQKLWGL